MTRTVYKEFQWCEGFEVYSKGKTLTSEARPSGQTQLHPPSPGVVLGRLHTHFVPQFLPSCVKEANKGIEFLQLL